jgi:Sulfotransferase domain
MTDLGPLPTFLVIGAQKSATRWLKANLSEHPDMFVAPQEVGYFHDPDRVRDDGPAWYRAQFAGWGGEAHVGEGTPGYMIWHHRPADIAERIHVLVPDVRLVALLRNPVDRALSAFVHFQRWGKIDDDADPLTMIRQEVASGSFNDTRPPETFVRGWGGPQTLVTGGWYGASLDPFVERFGGQLQVVLHDDVVADPAGVYRSVLVHLGADPAFVPEDLEALVFSNARRRGRWFSGRRGLSDQDRRELFGLFRDDIGHLEQITGRDLSLWDPP